MMMNNNDSNKYNNANQNFLEEASKILYGDKTRKEKEERELRESLINELNDTLEPKHILYSSVDDLKKIKEERDSKKRNSITTNLNNGLGLGENKFVTGLAAPVNKQDKDNKNNKERYATPIEDLKSRQQYLKQNKSLPNQKLIPGVNGSRSYTEPEKIDNRKMSLNTIKK